MRIISAVSGEEGAVLDAAEYDAWAQGGATVGALKRHLAETHFDGEYNRFQLRLLAPGDEVELPDELGLTGAESLQLIRLKNHLEADPERDTHFVRSCREGRVDEVEAALKRLQDPNVSEAGRASALCQAVSEAHQEVVRLLLEAGASPDAGFVALHAPSFPPLIDAAMFGHLEIARLLWDFGADIEATLMDQTALHIAAWEGRLEIVRLLLERGANKEAQDGEGNRPLHLAAEDGYVEVVRLLLQSGAQKEARNVEGETPHDMTLLFNNGGEKAQELKQLLYVEPVGPKRRRRA